MGHLRTSLVLLIAFVPAWAMADQEKKVPSREDDLELLRGRWVQVKPDSKIKVTLVFGHKEDKDEIKNYLIVAVTTQNKGKEEIKNGSFGRIGLHDAGGKRTFSYKKEEGGEIGYKISAGKLILEGDYVTADVKRKLTEEWKKLAEPTPLPDVGKALLGEWERKGVKDDPKIMLEFRPTKDKEGVELGTWVYWKKDNGEGKGHFAKFDLKEEEAPGLASLPGASRPIWARVLTPSRFIVRGDQPIYHEFKDGKLQLEGRYEYKGTKINMTGEWTKVEKK